MIVTDTKLDMHKENESCLKDYECIFEEDFENVNNPEHVLGTNM